jgi:DNA-binding response OmpR family regulator
MDERAPRARVLVVEDDRALADALREFLEGQGFAAEAVASGQEAIERVAAGDVDVVVLDLMLPDVDGYDVTRAVHDLTSAPVPILMLTARSQPADKLRGFAAGVDDYVVKPFDPEELAARLRALLRRSGRGGTDVHRLGALVVDRSRRALVLGERSVYLSPREFEVLETLAAVPGRPLSRSQLVARAWGLDADTDARTVDTTIVRLRRKLEALAGDDPPPVAIATLWGVGYRLDTGEP